MMDAATEAPLAPPQGNPVLDEIDRAHASLSPAAQAALDQAHGMLGIQPPRSAAAVTSASQPAPMMGGSPAVAPALGSQAKVAMQPQLKQAQGKSTGEKQGGNGGEVPPMGVREPEPVGASESASPVTDVNAPATELPNQTPPIRIPPTQVIGPMTNQEKLAHDQQAGTWASRIHNPFGRALATIPDAIASGLFPRIAQFIPGTSAHHALDIGQDTAAVNEEQAARAAADKSAQEQAITQHETAETGAVPSQQKLREAQASEALAKADAALNPKEGGTVHEAADGTFWVIHPDGKATQVAPQGQPLKGKPEKDTGTVHESADGNMWVVKSDGTALPVKPKSDGTQPEGAAQPAPVGAPPASTATAPVAATATATPVIAPAPTQAPVQLKGKPKEGETPLGNVPQMNKALEARYQVLHPGGQLPPFFTLPGNATQKDYDRIDKALEGTEKAVGTKAQQDSANEMRRQTMELSRQTHEESKANREHKDENSIRQASFKAYTPALDSAERFNVMTKNYEDAIKNHDQQAMLSLLANHLGMTMGLQKGARMTKDIIGEAERSRPWLQGLKAKFDKDGVLSGVTLTPEQMRQMVSLGRERFSEDITKARNEARYQGSTDEGPDRTPNQATVNHYVAQSKGDRTAAKDAMAQDGWSVK